MINKILHSTIALALLVSFTACSGGGDSSDGNNTSDTNNTVFSGVAVDGYISGAKVCLDTNINGLCDTGESTTSTQSDGTFSFADIKIAEGLLLPVIVSGGTDIATNKFFVGEMKNILNSDTLTTTLYVTPLTDLVASSFLASETKSTATLSQAKREIASSLGLSSITLESDPMKNKEVFVKTQEIRQAAGLMLTSALKATDSESNVTKKAEVLKNISLAMAESLTSTSELNTTAVLAQLNTLDSTIVIPTNETTFIYAQVSELKTSLQKMLTDSTVTTTDLENKQILIESNVETATTTLSNATVNQVLEVVTVDLTENTAPVANANRDQNVKTATLVQLNASLSSDADNDTLTYAWSIESKPSESNITLSDSTSVQPTFKADVDGSYIFGLVVNDGMASSVKDSVTITATVENTDPVSNSAPVADANKDQNVKTSSLVRLSGIYSSDVDNDLLSYTWRITSKPSLSSASLVDSTTISPSFTADVDGSYVFNLVVNDGNLNSTADTVTINATTANVAPTANANQDQNVKTSLTVTLDGSLSSDADKDTLTYAWEMTSKPSTSITTLVNTTTVNPIFVADVNGSYIFSLVVNDAVQDSLADTVVVNASVDNAAPVANANKDQNIKTTSTVTLDGSLSSDADFNQLKYNWRIISKPSLSAATLSDSTVAHPTFVANVDGSYIFSLVVNDGTLDSKADFVIVNASAANSAPVSNANKDQNINTATLVTLDGSLSSDADNDTLNYTWELVSKPSLSNASLANATVVNPTFTPDIDGIYVFSLVVNDGALDSQRDVVLVEAKPIRVSHNSVGYGIVTSPFTQRVWLDRNLGASNVCTALDDTSCYGDYYQWGRAADGHQNTLNETNSTFTTKSTFPYDWTIEDSSGAIRAVEWSATDGSSICPVGYRVPTLAEITAETVGATTIVGDNEDAYNNFLKLPSSGYRSYIDASMNNQGTYGYLWSTGVGANSDSTPLFFQPGFASTNTSTYRAIGYPVRCIQN